MNVYNLIGIGIGGAIGYPLYLLLQKLRRAEKANPELKKKVNKIISGILIMNTIVCFSLGPYFFLKALFIPKSPFFVRIFAGCPGVWITGAGIISLFLLKTLTLKKGREKKKEKS